MSRAEVDPEAPIPEVLSAAPPNGGEQRALPSPAVRLRKVTALTPLLHQAGVDIEVEDDGRLSVCLPPAMLEVFLLDLGQQLEAWRTAMRKARLQESERNAQTLAASDDARRKLEADQDARLQEYETLTIRGLSHRAATQKISGYRGHRGREADHLPVDFLLWGIGQAKARRRQQRNTRIAALAAAGATAKSIAAQVGLTPAQVKIILKQEGERAGSDGPGPRPAAVTVRRGPRGPRPATVARDEKILALASEGLSRWEIADRLHISYAVVCNALKQAGVPMPDRRRRAGMGY